MLDMQSKCPYGSCRGGSITLALSKMEFIWVIVKCPAITYSTKRSILDVTGILNLCIIHVQPTLEVAGSLYIVILYHLKEIVIQVSVSAFT